MKEVKRMYIVEKEPHGNQKLAVLVLVDSDGNAWTPSDEFTYPAKLVGYNEEAEAAGINTRIHPTTYIDNKG